jgi:hypothetical protein
MVGCCRELIEGEIANRFFVAVRGQLEKSGLMSDEHFTVDGTMLEAWANRRSFREKADPPERGSGHGGKRLLRDTHESRMDPEARLYRKCQRGSGRTQLSETPTDGKRSRADWGGQCDGGRDAGRAGGAAADNVVPHVAEYERGNLQRNSLRAEQRTSPEFFHSQKKRKLVKQSLAWIKHWAGFRQTKVRVGGGVEPIPVLAEHHRVPDRVVDRQSHAPPEQ